jgi:hypothetical protein
MENCVELILSHGRIKPEIADGDKDAQSRFYELEPRGDAFSLEIVTSIDRQFNTVYFIISDMMANLCIYYAAPNPTAWGPEGFTRYEHDVLMPWFKDKDNKVTSHETQIIGGLEILESRLSTAIKDIIFKLLQHNIDVRFKIDNEHERLFSAHEYNNPPKLETALKTFLNFLKPDKDIDEMIEQYKSNIPKEKRHVLEKEYYYPPPYLYR